MTPQQLKKLVARYQSARAFVDAFNTAASFEALDETVLNNQIAGRRGLSKAWIAAYTIFSRNYSAG